MKRKFGLANYLKFKNCIQKGAIALVATMLLVIPNMSVYSSVGSYQGLSQAAVRANESHKQANPIANVAWITSFICFGPGLVAAYLVNKSLMGGITNSLSDQNYEKNDFSQFDN